MLPNVITHVVKPWVSPDWEARKLSNALPQVNGGEPGVKIDRKDLLVELGCEELPPKALDVIRESFYAGIKAGLEKQNILFDPGESRSFSTPRRLAVLFSGVSARQPDQDQERRGPALTAAFDDEGNPTPAATGFARSLGLEVSDLETIKSGNRIKVKGKIAGFQQGTLKINPALII